MPHLILEHSSNLIEKTALPSLFKKCHVLLAEMLPTEVKSCVSRAIECDRFCVGEGQGQNAFIHVSLRVKAGRTFETLQKTGESLAAMIKEYCVESGKQFNLQISVEIIELQKTYFHA
jgi:5-carboxymethyl-2-hydroxymuconate isomerase